MQLYQAESGRVIQLNTSASTIFNQNLFSLDLLQKEIEKLTTVPVHDQIILTQEGFQLQDLSSFSPEQARLFVYDRQLFEDDVGQTLEEDIVRAVADLTNPHALDQEAEFAVQRAHTSATLRSSVREKCEAYLELFQSHVKLGAARAASAKVNAAICKQLQTEQRIQLEALNVALMNLQEYSNSLLASYDLFKKWAQKELTKRENLLTSFQVDLFTLTEMRILSCFAQDALPLSSSLELTSSLAENSRTLISFLPEQKLRDNARDCLDHHEDMVIRIKQVRDMIQEIQLGTQTVRNQIMEFDLSSLDALMEKSQNYAQLLQSQLQVFERDHQRVRNMINEILATTPSLARDRFIALDQLVDVHTEEYLVETLKWENFVRDAALQSSDSKLRLTRQLLLKLREISTLQSLVATTLPELNRLNSEMDSLADQFSELLHAHRVPIAYGALLVELLRRKEYSRWIGHVANEVAESLATIRAGEIKRREEFMTNISSFLPFKILGIYDQPPTAEINIIDKSTENLITVTRSDLEEFNKEVLKIRDSITEELAIMTHPLSVVPDKNTVGSTVSESLLYSINKMTKTMEKMLEQADALPEIMEKAMKIRLSNQKVIRKKASFNVKLPETITNKPSGFLLQPQSKREYSPLISPQFGGAGGSAAGGKDEYLYDTLRKYEDRIRYLEDMLAQSGKSEIDKKDDEILNLQVINSNLQHELEKVKLELENSTGKYRNDIDKLGESQAILEEQNKEFHENIKLSLKFGANEPVDESAVIKKINQIIEENEKGVALLTDAERTISEQKEDLSSCKHLVQTFLEEFSTIQQVLTKMIKVAEENTPLKMDKSLLGTFNSLPCNDDLVAMGESIQAKIKEFSKNSCTLCESLIMKLLHMVDTQEETIHVLETNYDHCKSKLEIQEHKISFRNFNIGDLALFLPTRHPRAWAAFHVEAPNYFLSLDPHVERLLKKKEWLLAKIKHIARRIAHENDPLSTDFGIPNNTEYYLVQVERYKTRLSLSSDVHPSAPPSSPITTAVRVESSSVMPTSSTSKKTDS